MKQSEKGSVTMVVVVTIFFIVILLSSFFIYTSSRRRAQLEETGKIANAYDGDMNAIYAEISDKYKEKSTYNYDPSTSGISLYSLSETNTENEEQLQTLSIPSEYEGKPVTVLGTIDENGDLQGFYYSKIVELIIPDSVTEIIDGNAEDRIGVFSNCRELKKVTLSKSLSKIGSFAFKGCSSLENITIPASVQNIGEEAFGDWTEDQTIYIEGKTSAADFESLGQNCFGNAKVEFLGTQDADNENQNLNNVNETRPVNNLDDEDTTKENANEA